MTGETCVTVWMRRVPDATSPAPNVSQRNAALCAGLIDCGICFVKTLYYYSVLLRDLNVHFKRNMTYPVTIANALKII